MVLVFALSSIRNVVRIFVELFLMCVFYEFFMDFLCPKRKSGGLMLGPFRFLVRKLSLVLFCYGQ